MRTDPTSMLFSATKPAEQDKKVEDLRAELTEIELKLREANEMELPEEEFRVAAEAKREELNGLVKEFTELNMKEFEARQAKKESDRHSSRGDPNGGRGGGRNFERPSERRRRLEREREGDGYGGHGGHYDYDERPQDDAFASFGGTGRRNSRRGGRGGDGG